MNRTYPKSNETTIDWTVDTIHAYLVDLEDYTPNFGTDDFLDDIPGAALVAGPVALTGKTNVLGVLDADDVIFTAVTGDESEAVILVKDTGVPATSPLFLFYDGKYQVEIAADAAGGATTIIPEDMPAPIGSLAVLVLISGTGPATIVTSAAAAEGARTLAVSALASAITAGAVYEYSADGAGLPITPAGSDVIIEWSNGARKIIAL